MIYEAIAYLHPELMVLEDYEIRDSGNGPELVRWPEGVPFPSDSEQLAALFVVTRQRKLDEINRLYEGEFAAIKRQYPDAERESWPIQLREAELLLTNPQAATPFLDALLMARAFGENKVELADKVRAKNEAYAGLSAALTGKRHKLERQLVLAETLEQVQSVVW
ncbi:XkdW family protein [Pseudomonas sp. LFM046]|uniref:XkdW family protein n=1 Tax=Pseudomonas sp. LFM046 TaxID=1608357 RepID=UPI0011AF3139|nr:XkdW family protein [Pseudomonas sp. LFM046]